MTGCWHAGAIINLWDSWIMGSNSQSSWHGSWPPELHVPQPRDPGTAVPAETECYGPRPGLVAIESESSVTCSRMSRSHPDRDDERCIVRPRSIGGLPVRWWRSCAHAHRPLRGTAREKLTDSGSPLQLLLRSWPPNVVVVVVPAHHC
jgi:hypothetical protein